MLRLLPEQCNDHYQSNGGSSWSISRRLADLGGSPEPEDISYTRTAVTLGAAEVISDWLTVEAHQSNKAEVTDMVLVPAAIYVRAAETAGGCLAVR